MICKSFQAEKPIEYGHIAKVVVPWDPEIPTICVTIDITALQI